MVLVEFPGVSRFAILLEILEKRARRSCRRLDNLRRLLRFSFSFLLLCWLDPLDSSFFFVHVSKSPHTQALQPIVRKKDRVEELIYVDVELRQGAVAEVCAGKMPRNFRVQLVPKSERNSRGSNGILY